MLSVFRRDPVVWIVRVLWVALPFTAGPVLAHALSETSDSVRIVSTVGLWVGWAVGMIASCVPSAIALTALRILAPAGAAGAVGAALDGHVSPVALGWTLVTAAWVCAPALGEWCVNGPAYPNERRLLLRTPGPLLGGLLGLVLAWDAVVLGLGTGPLLLAARQWVLGAAACVVGFPLAFVFVRSLHGFSKRWVVFVPAGLVLHDPISLRDPVLFQRRHVESIRLADRRAAGDAIDVTQRAGGPAIELRTRQPATLTLMRFGQASGQTVEGSTIVFTPTRPGAVLEEAERRHFPGR